MPEVKLEITTPANGMILDGAGGYSVNFTGRALSSGHPPLFYRWYSTLNKAADQDKVALNWNDIQASAEVRGFTAVLDVGTHVITLGAKDRVSDALDEVKLVQFAGLAGGDASAPAPCIVHVLRARIPSDQAVSLSKANSLLKAAAPFKWADTDYGKVNQIAFVWRFEPRGAPANRRTAKLENMPLTFIPAASANDDPVVQYSGPLPSDVDTGNYTLVLRVQHKAQLTRGNEARLDVVIGA